VAAGRVHIDADIIVAGSGKRHELGADLLRQFLRDAAIDEDRTRLEKIRLRVLAQGLLGLLVFLFVFVVHSTLQHDASFTAHSATQCVKQCRKKTRRE